MLKMESNPRNQLRDWHKRMRQAWRSTGQQTRDVESEEENIQESIKEDAKRRVLTTSMKALGNEHFGSKGTVNHLQEHKSLLTAIPKHLGESVAIAQNIGNVSKISHWMKLAKKDHQVAPPVNHSSKINHDMRFQIDPQRCAKPFSPYEYNNRMKARVGNVNEVLRLFTEMKANGCNPNVLCYNTVLDCLVMTKSFEKIKVYFDEMLDLKISPNVSTWNILVKYSCYQGQFDEAFKILSASGCNPDIRTYSTLISGLIRDRRVEDAYDLLNEMLNKGYHPDVYSYTPIVQGFCAKGEINRAKQLIDLMWKNGCPPNNVTYKFLLDALCRLGNFDEVESILKESGSKGWKPNANSYNIYIKGLCMAGKVEEAHRKLEDFMDGSYNFGCNVGYLVYNTVMNTFCESLKEQENAFCKRDKLITILKLLTDMLKKGVVPNTGTYNIVVHSLCEAGMLSTAKLMVQCKGFAVDVVTYNTLINGFYKVGKFEEVEHLCLKMTTMDNINPDMFTYSILIGMYCTQGKVLKADGLLQKSVTLGFSPDLVVYGALIDGCLKKRELVLGWKVFGRMLEQGLVPNFIIFDSLIRACCGELNKLYVSNTIVYVLQKR